MNKLTRVVIHMKISEIFIGKVDGAAEALDSNFENLFYKDNHIVNQIINDSSKNIICGRKGTGKTMLAQYLKCYYESKNCIAKNFPKGELEYNKLNEKIEKLNQEEYLCFFKFCILTQVAMSIISTYKFKDAIKNIKNIFKVLRFKSAIKKLKKFYLERYGIGNYKNSAHESTVSNESEISGKIMQEFLGLGVNKKESYSSKKIYNLKSFTQIINELTELISDCLKYCKVVLIIDDLDEQSVNLLNDNKFEMFIFQFLSASFSLNDEILSKYGSRCIVVIRDDILESINYCSSNSNKRFTDSSVKLYWVDNRRNQWETDLCKMILHKIRVSTKSDLSDKQLYFKYFSEKINDKTVFEFIMQHSYYRPRDVINYLNRVKLKNPNDDTFTKQGVMNCRLENSKFLLNEIKNEMSLYFEKDYIKNLISFIKCYNKRTFSISEIKRYYSNSMEQFPSISSIDEAVKHLYQFNVIGNKNGKYLTWAYRDDGDIDPNMEHKFTIHNGLIKSLNK